LISTMTGEVDKCNDSVTCQWSRSIVCTGRRSKLELLISLFYLHAT